MHHPFVVISGAPYTEGLVKMDMSLRSSDRLDIQFVRLLSKRFPPVRHLLTSICPSLMRRRFKEHQGNPFLSLAFIWHVCVCVCFGILWIEMCTTHIHTHTTLKNMHARCETYPYIYTNTPPLCSAVNTMIVFLCIFSRVVTSLFSTRMVEMKFNYLWNGSPTLLLLWRNQLAWVTTVGPKCAQ